MENILEAREFQSYLHSEIPSNKDGFSFNKSVEHARISKFVSHVANTGIEKKKNSVGEKVSERIGKELGDAETTT